MFGTNENHKTGIDLIYTSNPNVIANKQKNIYDMAGNVTEWTMEACYTSRRANRGGSYGTRADVAYSASTRSSSPSATLDIFEGLGFRIAFYL